MGDEEGKGMTDYEIDSDQTMREIADYIVGKTGGLHGFAVVVFPFQDEGGGGTANYISNASRPDMIRALREKADVLERNMDIPVDPDIKIQ